MGKVMTPCAYLVAASNLVALHALVGGGLPPHARRCRAVRIKAQALLVTQPGSHGQRPPHLQSRPQAEGLSCSGVESTVVSAASHSSRQTYSLIEVIDRIRALARLHSPAAQLLPDAQQPMDDKC